KGELSSMLTPLPTASPQPQASTLPLDAHTKDAPVSAHVAPQRDIRALAEQLVLQRFGEGQFPAFSAIVERESGWRTDAAEQSTGAYGLGQALPPEKMAAYGEDWQENPETQIRWMLDYIAARYGSPSQAWDFWQAHRWY
ncbi:lytic transglycosylase domain-containing protein, partial [Patescibacteria group bacterium]|nr:lytic transglycosylase domain-containing protein [Patescibacteria group bacterium]